ncbi:MAG: phosphatidylserine decarboxylase [Methylacidiphilales bacterium]|nr:phosphatidylserine decarboxylase [Candidatus Methylacidiphilales bacterium]
MPSAYQEMARFAVPLGLLACVALFVPPFLPASWIIAKLAFCGLGILLALLLLFVCYFFRDPERSIPADGNIVVSAADGLVVGVEEMEEPDFKLGRMRRIAVFLSVFDVHINRAPFNGTVQKTVYKPGEFLDVRHPESSTRNECLSWSVKTPRGPMAVRQIAGLVARRIVAWSAEGKSWKRGERIGMIRFGSRTEVFVPLECTVLVKPGDRVAGAATPIARWPGRE